MEHLIVRDIPMDTLCFSGMRGKGLRHACVGSGRLVRSIWQARRILRERSADVVLGMGGYICVPGGIAAATLGRPLVLMNADHQLLLSNRLLAPLAHRIAFGLPGLDSLISRKAVFTGNPVRPEIEALPPPEQRFADRQGPLRVLVMGGSQGAQMLNEVVPRAIASLSPEQRPLVLHQCGRGNEEVVRATYSSVGVADRVEIVSFIDNVASALGECDLAICRSGAITVSELCAGGVPSVLVPLRLGTTTHQLSNARQMHVAQAAYCLDPEDVRPERLAQILREANRASLLKMAQRARARAQPRAVSRLSGLLEQLVGRASH